jgi:hypothetical protein
LKELVNTAYDKQARLGIKQKKEPENKKLAEEYAVARETYETQKDIIKEATKPVVLTEQEKPEFLA